MKHYVFLRRLSDNACWGGCENRLHRYFEETDYSRNRITLLTTHDIFSQKLVKKGMPVHVVDFRLSTNGSFIKNFGHMFKLLKALKPDRIVFVQGSFLDFLLPEFLAGFFIAKGNIYALEVSGAPELPKKTSKRHLKYFQGLGLWWYKEMLFRSLRGWLCKSILVVSEEVRGKLIKWYHYPKKRVVTVFTGIDTKKFSPNDEGRKKMREKHIVPENDIIIVSSARFSKEKCVDRLINAFDQLWPDHGSCWLFLVGDGPQRHDLEKLARGKTSSSRIKFLGFQENIADYLRMGDIYVLPSDIEGIASAALEAMASKLVCVATKTAGPNRFIQDGINGYLVERSQKGVFDGLKKALNCSREQRNQMADKARKFVQDQYVSKSNINNAVKILELA